MLTAMDSSGSNSTNAAIGSTATTRGIGYHDNLGCKTVSATTATCSLSCVMDPGPSAGIVGLENTVTASANGYWRHAFAGTTTAVAKAADNHADTKSPAENDTRSGNGSHACAAATSLPQLVSGRGSRTVRSHLRSVRFPSPRFRALRVPIRAGNHGQAVQRLHDLLKNGYLRWSEA
ncbi:hypothetical protein [Streptomyces tibetensis]|uniref:hypothetical protein n=1 Tax=Streptomyces tibetensis TaxID=2382123 RepID=UPI0034119620